jgi:hypothetical protein
VLPNYNPAAPVLADTGEVLLLNYNRTHCSANAVCHFLQFTGRAAGLTQEVIESIQPVVSYNCL